MRRAASLLLALSACTGVVGDAPPSLVKKPDESSVAAPQGLRRLLAWQYLASVEDLLGPQAALIAAPPEDAAINGYDAIGAASMSVTTRDADTYERSAFEAARAAVASPGAAELVGCDLATGDDACLRTFVARFGRHAFRRTLSGPETDALVRLGKSAEASAGFPGAVIHVIAAVLQSPSFLFQVEVGVPDGTDRRLTGPELATRLSFFLNGTPPPEPLLDAAEHGGLDDPEQVRAAAALLLESPRARYALSAFFDEMLKLRELATISKAPRFKLTPSLRAAMRQETLHFLDDVVWEQDGDFRQILDAPFTYLNGELADFYGIPGVTGDAFRRVDFDPDSDRAGILGQASFLAVNAHNTLTSPTLRGKFVREVLMCQGVPSPPADFASTLPEPMDGEPPRTMRERMTAHLQSSVCRGCHVLMDPIGLGLEAYDAVGQFRTFENGIAVDGLSTMEGETFTGPRELGAMLKARPSVTACIVRNVFRQATGHVELAPEEASLLEIGEGFAASGYRMKALLVEVAASEAFRVLPGRAP